MSETGRETNLTAVERLALSMTDERIADALDEECETILQLLIHGHEHQIAEHVGSLKSWSGMLRGRSSRLPKSGEPDACTAAMNAERERCASIAAGWDEGLDYDLEPEATVASSVTAKSIAAAIRKSPQ